jgi:hypothetical protein
MMTARRLLLQARTASPARKRYLETRARQDTPAGKSPKTLAIPSRKNIPLNPSGKSSL